MQAGFHGDTLEHRERSYELIDQPLEAYFELIGQRPGFGAYLPSGRGYAANWVIEDGWLYLSSLAGNWGADQPLSMRHMFPFAGTKVFAAWYCGTLRAYRTDRPLPEGDDPTRMRYPDVVLTIDNGRLSNASVVHRASGSPIEPFGENALEEPAPAGALAYRRHAAWTQAVV